MTKLLYYSNMMMIFPINWEQKRVREKKCVQKCLFKPDHTCNDGYAGNFFFKNFKRRISTVFRNR